MIKKILVYIIVNFIAALVTVKIVKKMMDKVDKPKKVETEPICDNCSKLRWKSASGLYKCGLDLKEFYKCPQICRAHDPIKKESSAPNKIIVKAGDGGSGGVNKWGGASGVNMAGYYFDQYHPDGIPLIKHAHWINMYIGVTWECSKFNHLISTADGEPNEPTNMTVCPGCHAIMDEEVSTNG